jgi:anti-sigma B factor antagonist
MIQLNEQMREGWCVVAVGGRVDAETAEALEGALISAIYKNPRVAVDFAMVDYISSAGLGSLIQIARAAQMRQVGFILCAPTERVKNVFDMTGLNQIIEIAAGLPC